MGYRVAGLFDIPARMLPEVRSSSELYGNTEERFIGGIPVAGIAGDQQAALFRTDVH